MFRLRFAYLVEEGEISTQDAEEFKNFIDYSSHLTFTMYLYGRLGQLPHLEGDSTYQATCRVMAKLGLDNIEIDRKTAQPYEEQFWDQYDVIMELTEQEMMNELPAFVTDPSNKAKVEALLAGRRQAAIGHDTSRKIEAAL